MDIQIIQAALDTLAEGYGRHDTPGWMILATIIATVAGSFTAKVLFKKRQANALEKDQALKKSSLKAVLISVEQREETKHEAEIIRVNEAYKLTFSPGLHSGCPIEKHFKSLDDLESFLRSNTKFILSDFK